MDVVASLACAATPEAVFDVCHDLERYPEWLDIVTAVRPDDDAAAGTADESPAWTVDLRGQIGPFRRRKRLRMVRTSAERPSSVRFDRAEVDGKNHAPWSLEVSIGTAAGEAEGETQLTMRLHYGGNLWVPVLDRLLADEIERSKPRLQALVAG